jgi:hypothetical protein
MNESMLGSEFEMSLRILLMMNSLSDIWLDDVQIASIDFIAVYSADFCLLDENLHGYGNYRFGEYAARKELVSSALRELVLGRYISLNAAPDGYRFSITPKGKDVCQKLTSSYADEYMIAIKAVSKRFDINDSSAMIRAINANAEKSLEDTVNG